MNKGSGAKWSAHTVPAESSKGCTGLRRMSVQILPKTQQVTEMHFLIRRLRYEVNCDRHGRHYRKIARSCLDLEVMSEEMHFVLLRIKYLCSIVAFCLADTMFAAPGFASSSHGHQLLCLCRN